MIDGLLLCGLLVIVLQKEAISVTELLQHASSRNGAFIEDLHDLASTVAVSYISPSAVVRSLGV